MKILDGKLFKQMLTSGANHLANNKKHIDTLNVFPVPDGDTGTNMSMTFSAGVADATSCLSDDLSEVARALSKGLLMGARGNSGVITSQIFRGFYQHLESNNNPNVTDVALAFVEGYKAAYRAIMKPVEGTILTVIRESSEMAYHHVLNNPDIELADYFKVLLDYAKDSLEYTPELLPILKEVGVVDSGGAGLVVILEGLYKGVCGEIYALSADSQDDQARAALEIENDEFGYCTEFIVRLNEDFMERFKEEKLRKALSDIGNSLVVVRDEELVKVHVHTLRPGDALNIGQRYGDFIKLKIENMQEQHSTIIHQSLTTNNPSPMGVRELPRSKYWVIAVCAGEGMSSLFKEYRADKLISGGQTMNPSTQDFVEAIKETNCEHIIILPNNSNIILAANQAAKIMDDHDVQVLNAKSLQAGLSALTMFNPDAELAENLANMNEAIEHVQVASVTYAIKDTSYEGVEVKAGDYLAMSSKKIIASGSERHQVLCALIDEFKQFADYELLTIYEGADASEQETSKLVDYINQETNFEVEVLKGNQPVYAYLFALE